MVSMIEQTINKLLRNSKLCHIHKRRLVYTLYSKHYCRHVHNKPSTHSNFIVTPHINIKAVLSDINALQHNLQARNINNIDIQHIQQLYSKYTALHITLQDLRTQRNKYSKFKPNSTTAVTATATATDAIEASKLLKQQINQCEHEFNALESTLYNELYKLPNTISSHTPIGTELQYRIIDECNQRTYDDTGINHMDFCHKYNLVDFESAAITTGSRFVYVKNDTLN